MITSPICVLLNGTVSVAMRLAKDHQSSKLARAVEDIERAYFALQAVKSELSTVAAPLTPGVLERVLAAADVPNLYMQSGMTRPRGKRMANGTRAERGPDLIATKPTRSRK